MDTNEMVIKATPGMKIGPTDQFELGEGTFERNGSIFSSLVGVVRIQSTNETTEGVPGPEGQTKQVIFVEAANAKPTIVPKEKSVVLAQVTKITPRFASVAILSIDDITLSEYFPGTIRVSDVRMAQADQVEIYKCFRPGDIVRAEVISLGDSRAYYLSTAKNEYGVIMAKSMSGYAMVPVSWNLMQCPKTKLKEYRKVAKT